MPISGVVITTKPEQTSLAQTFLAGLAEVEVHGADDRGNIVAVFDTRSVDEMEQLIEKVNRCPSILHTGVTYINMEDLDPQMSGEER